MSRLSRTSSALGGTTVLLLLGVASPSYAGSDFQSCIDQAVNHGGEPPTCTKVDGQWVASWPGDPGASGSVAGVMALLVVLGVLVAIGLLVWRVTTAQKLARQSGMDPSLATQMALLSDDGLDATYLAASLRQPQQGPGPQPLPAGSTGPAAARLAELTGLLDQGLITQAEYDERRRAIIDSV